MIDKIAVLIPCYNESKSIAKVVKDAKEALPEATIYVYDNNSTDGTDEIARQAGAIVRYERQQGKGNVIRSMFRDIDAQCYLMLDGDDTYPAEFAPEMCRKVLEEGVDMVVGDRLSSTYFTENKRPFHNFGNTIVRAFINHLFRSDIKDIMTGYRAMSYEFVKTFPVLSKNFEIETEMTIHAIDKKMHVENVVVDYRDRQEGSVSKLNTYSDGFNLDEAALKGVSIIGHMGYNSTTWKNCIQLLENGTIDHEIFISHRMPLSKWREGIELVRDRKATKVILLPEEDA